ncbi:hypothetical protein RFI_36762, partial [Reticulomyxa filosa]
LIKESTETNTIGAFTFFDNEKDNLFKWKNLYKLRVRGCSLSGVVVTPFSNITTVYVTTQFMESLIIKNEEVSYLLSFLPKGSNSNVSLLYRGSRDGFEAKIFHLTCNRMGKTLTIVQSKNNFVFGGFTNSLWWSRKTDKVTSQDNGAFVFSLRNADGVAHEKYCIREGEEEHAIKNSEKFGPYFGNKKKNY